ncbi:hypothetical protein [Kitasatospora terrestris]|uniref:Lipoprotein n=1 Tax=Kitasatospora terrestris TaxID=258051 RepID=A0ABP9EKJ7_9ACTN
MALRPRPRPRLLGAAALLCAVTAVTAVTGCQADRPPAEPSAFSSALPTRTVAGAVVPVLPLDAYRLTAAQQDHLQQAADRIAADCMRAQGLTWPARPAAQGVEHDSDERRYGVSDARTVAATGYRVPPPAGVTAEQLAERKRAVEARNAAMTEAVVAAYTGEKPGATTPQEAGRGGCRGEAEQRLGLPSGYADGTDAVETAVQEGWNKTAADPRAKDADAKWSACMHGSGYDYADPHQAAGDPAWRPGAPGVGPTPDAREKAVAVRDVECKRSTGYLTAWQTVEIEQQNALIKDREPQLRAVADQWHQALVRAEQLLG